MSRRKAKRQKTQIIKYESNNMSKEQMIEVQAEAYYRALKRIEEDKNKLSEQEPEKKKRKWYEEVLFFINVCLWPWKINKRFSVSNRVYDSILVISVSGILRFAGGCMWLSGLACIVSEIYNMFIQKNLADIFGNVLSALLLLLLGSVFIVAGGEFKKETDSNKIYAYSASIIALISCIVSILTLVGM